MTLKDDTPVKNQPLCVQPCNGGDAQRFTMNTRFQIQMAAYPDMCVAERSSYDVVIQPCSVVARKTWVWDYDIGRQ
jgi:hypothetical protein